eukprot:TRINITY_DN10651_c0_g1_i10.p1 TRINITY_DN10651_c0_g1~~TRINITY_DN10651_c0_g1_i10.p1  ORF type:complete len:231 (-),score=42.28 TRINITY_DN10651_c0_g1_i10:108-800(-)
METQMESVQQLKSLSRIYASSQEAFEKWPTGGSITFESVNHRNFSGAPLILKSFNVQYKAGEKIGMIGQTREQISSILDLLYRVSNQESGQISVGDLPISVLSFRELSSGLSVIPYPPKIFTGTLKFNLDPEGRFPNDKILNLSRHFLPQFQNFQTQVTQELPIREQMLICVVRSLLREPKILFVEQTGVVDVEQIFQAFSSSTVVVFVNQADRLNLRFDHVVEMDDDSI